jgi:hypothetical protein
MADSVCARIRVKHVLALGAVLLLVSLTYLISLVAVDDPTNDNTIDDKLVIDDLPPPVIAPQLQKPQPDSLTDTQLKQQLAVCDAIRSTSQ